LAGLQLVHSQQPDFVLTHYRLTEMLVALQCLLFAIQELLF